MLRDWESITENETRNVQNSGLKALKLGIIFIQATLSCFVVNAVQDCEMCELSVPVTALQEHRWYWHFCRGWKKVDVVLYWLCIKAVKKHMQLLPPI